MPGSPFPAGGQDPLLRATGVDCNCSSNHLFIGESVVGAGGSTMVSVQDIALNGALSPIASSPFIEPFSSTGLVVLSPDDSNLFVSNRSSGVTAFKVASSGALTLVPGSPFPAPGGLISEGMATNQAGTFLYVADFLNEVNGFSIAANGVLTSVPGSPFSNGFVGNGLFSLAVFPPKSCSGRTAGFVSPAAIPVSGPSVDRK